MYVLMATTKGDELVRPTTKALCASEDKWAVAIEMGRWRALRHVTLKYLEDYPYFPESDVYDRFDVVEVRTV